MKSLIEIVCLFIQKLLHKLTNIFNLFWSNLNLKSFPSVNWFLSIERSVEFRFDIGTEENIYYDINWWRTCIFSWHCTNCKELKVWRQGLANERPGPSLLVITLILSRAEVKYCEERKKRWRTDAGSLTLSQKYWDRISQNIPLNVKYLLPLTHNWNMDFQNHKQ